MSTSIKFTFQKSNKRKEVAIQEKEEGPKRVKLSEYDHQEILKSEQVKPLVIPLKS